MEPPTVGGCERDFSQIMVGRSVRHSREAGVCPNKVKAAHYDGRHVKEAEC